LQRRGRNRDMMELEKAGLNRFKKIVAIAKLDPVFSKDLDSINKVIKKILSTGYRKIPIISKNKLAGIAAITDILDAFLRKQNFDEAVSSIMTRDVIFCDAEDTIGFVLQKFKLSRRGSFPVIQDKKLVGMVSERDFVKYFANLEFGIKVEEAMTRKPFFLSSSATVQDCLKSVVNTRYRRLPILQNKKLVGIVTAIDLLKYITRKGISLGRPVDSIMIKNVVTISEDKDLSEAIKTMKTRDIGGIPVIDKAYKLEGIITERDILEEIV